MVMDSCLLDDGDDFFHIVRIGGNQREAEQIDGEVLSRRNRRIGISIWPIFRLRECLQFQTSSLFWIILAAFRLQIWGAIYLVDIAPQRFESKIGSKEPENRQRLNLKTLS